MHTGSRADHPHRVVRQVGTEVTSPYPAAQIDQQSLILWLLVDILRKLERIMTAQDDINAATAAFSTILTDIQGQVATLGTDVQQLTTLIGSGQPVDTSALDAIVATAAGIQTSLDTAVGSVTALATPTPPPVQ
jgi:hypothetical protein